MRRAPAAVLMVVCGALLVAAGARAAAPERQEDETVTLEVHHSAFDVDHLEFQQGETVRFVVRNRDPIDHELIIGGPAVQRRHEHGTERKHGAIPGEISVPAGETRSTIYTFTEPGTTLFGCHLPGHYAYGMKGTITTTE